MARAPPTMIEQQLQHATPPLWITIGDSSPEQYYDAVISIRARPSQCQCCRRSCKQQKALWRNEMSHRAARVLCLYFEKNNFSTASFVEKLIAFTKTLPLYARVLFDCRKSRSRCTAAAIILLREAGLDQVSAFKEVQRAQPTLTPNFSIVRLYRILKEADSNGSVLASEEWSE